jgi:Ner family transcriptional regulator
MTHSRHARSDLPITQTLVGHHSGQATAALAEAGWHPQDIIAAVRKKGTSLQALGRAHGFSRVTFNRATTERFPRAHAIIATFLMVPRHVIWPQFYDMADRMMAPPQDHAGRSQPRALR